MSIESAKPRSLRERLRSLLDNLEKWVIAMDDASPTSVIFERFHPLEARVEQLEHAYGNQSAKPL